MLFLPAVADSRILQKSSPVLSSYGGVGSNQIIGGQMVNRIFVTDNHAIVVILGPPKIEWANTHPVHPASYVPDLILRQETKQKILPLKTRHQSFFPRKWVTFLQF